MHQLLFDSNQCQKGHFSVFHKWRKEKTEGETDFFKLLIEVAYVATSHNLLAEVWHEQSLS